MKGSLLSSQRSLFNVLNAYSIFNNRVGYVQGMGFFTALLLTYMDEESSFWMLHALMMRYGQQYVFENGFPGLHVKFFVLGCLLHKEFPKLFKRLVSL